MTFEKKCFVRPEDILAVRFQCTGCKASTSIPIDKLLSGDIGLAITRVCPHCKTPSGFPYGTSEMEHFINFNLILGGLKEMMKGRGVEYGFEIECDTK
jgi:hypothetical protein